MMDYKNFKKDNSNLFKNKKNKKLKNNSIKNYKNNSKNNPKNNPSKKTNSNKLLNKNKLKKELNKNQSNEKITKINKINKKKDNWHDKDNKKSYLINNSKRSEFFKNRYEIFGAGTFKKLLKTKNELKNNQFIRINLSKTNIENVEKFLKKNRVKYSKTFIKNCLKIEKSFFSLSSSLLSLTGKIYFQELASQIPINTIDFKELKNKINQKKLEYISILDMAAAPGSKTTQIADLLNYHEINYKIIALEPNKERIIKLINNIQKQEFENIEIKNIEAQNFKSKNKFDIILLDAPCSGNLIDDNNWIEKRNLMGIEQNAALQRKLLKNAKKLLKEDGLLIYSTCSIEPEENELNIKFAIDKLNLKTEKKLNSNIKFNFKTSPLREFNGIKLNDDNSFRVMPYFSKTQGFFISLLKNK